MTTPVLPDDLVKAMADAKAQGSSSALLAELALANEIFNNNAATQSFMAQQQAMNQVLLATVAKTVSVILNTTTDGQESAAAVKPLLALIDELKGQYVTLQSSTKASQEANAQFVANLVSQLKQPAK